MDDKDILYTKQIEDMRIMRIQFDKLADEFGKMRSNIEDMPEIQQEVKKLADVVINMRTDLASMLVAMTGDRFNPDGIVIKVSKMQGVVDEVQKEVKDIKFQLNKKNLNINLIIIFVTFIATMLARTIWEWVTKK